MPNIKSAIKRMRQSRKKQSINMHHKRTLRSTIKKYRKRILEGDVNGAREILGSTYSQIDKSCKMGIIHPNKAARLKSRLTASLNRATS